MGRKSGIAGPQRCEIVLMLLRKEEPGAVLARRYGISEATLYRWRDEFLQAGQAALTNGPKDADAHRRRIEELQRSLEEREQVIGELTIANRILKKTAQGWYSTTPCART